MLLLLATLFASASAQYMISSDVDSICAMDKVMTCGSNVAWIKSVTVPNKHTATAGMSTRNLNLQLPSASLPTQPGLYVDPAGVTIQAGSDNIMGTGVTFTSTPGGVSHVIQYKVNQPIPATGETMLLTYYNAPSAGGDWNFFVKCSTTAIPAKTTTSFVTVTCNAGSKSLTGFNNGVTATLQVPVVTNSNTMEYGIVCAPLTCSLFVVSTQIGVAYTSQHQKALDFLWLDRSSTHFFSLHTESSSNARFTFLHTPEPQYLLAALSSPYNALMSFDEANPRGYKLTYLVKSLLTPMFSCNSICNSQPFSGTTVAQSKNLQAEGTFVLPACAPTLPFGGLSILTGLPGVLGKSLISSLTNPEATNMCVFGSEVFKSIELKTQQAYTPSTPSTTTTDSYNCNATGCYDPSRPVQLVSAWTMAIMALPIRTSLTIPGIGGIPFCEDAVCGGSCSGSKEGICGGDTTLRTAISEAINKVVEAFSHYSRVTRTVRRVITNTISARRRRSTDYGGGVHSNGGWAILPNEHVLFQYMAKQANALASLSGETVSIAKKVNEMISGVTATQTAVNDVQSKFNTMADTLNKNFAAYDKQMGKLTLDVSALSGSMKSITAQTVALGDKVTALSGSVSLGFSITGQQIDKLTTQTQEAFKAVNIGMGLMFQLLDSVKGALVLERAYTSLLANIQSLSTAMATENVMMTTCLASINSGSIGGCYPSDDFLVANPLYGGEDNIYATTFVPDKNVLMIAYVLPQTYATAMLTRFIPPPVSISGTLYWLDYPDVFVYSGNVAFDQPTTGPQFLKITSCIGSFCGRFLPHRDFLTCRTALLAKDYSLCKLTSVNKYGVAGSTQYFSNDPFATKVDVTVSTYSTGTAQLLSGTVQLTALQNTVTSTAIQVGSQTATLSSVSTQLATVQNDLSKLNPTTINTQLASLASGVALVAPMQASLASVSTAQQTQGQALTTVQQQQAAQSSTLNGVVSTQQTQTQAINNVQGSVSSLNTNLQSVVNSASQQSASLTTLSGTASNLQKELAAATAKVTAQQAVLSTLQTSIGSFATTSALTTVVNEVAVLTKDFAKITASTAALQAAIPTVNVTQLSISFAKLEHINVTKFDAIQKIDLARLTEVLQTGSAQSAAVFFNTSNDTITTVVLIMQCMSMFLLLAIMCYLIYTCASNRPQSQGYSKLDSKQLFS